jgi:hypothetical protein
MFSLVCLTALTIGAEGGNAEIAKPRLGIGSGASEIVLPIHVDPHRMSVWRKACSSQAMTPTARNSKNAVWAFN